MAEKVEKTLNERIKELTIVSLNGVTYLCKTEKNKDEIKFTEALDLSGMSFEGAVSEWIKRDNLGTLESFEISGSNYTLAKKPFNDEHNYIIDMVAAKATYNMSKALKKLQNDSF